MKRVFLLTGRPGTGKTAIIKEAIAKTKIRAGGFYTEEIRVSGVRQGFRIISLDGREAILAHTNISSPYQVSKYRVDIESLNRVGVSAIHQALEESDLIVIDEIGKMELLSPQFKEAVWQVINSRKRVLGTIMLSPYPFADEIKRHPEVKVLLVTRANHDEVLKEILNWLEIASMKITLKPLGDVDSEIVKELGEKVNLTFHCPVEIKTGFSYLAHAYNPEKRQYLASSLLASLNAPPRQKDEGVAGIVDVDLYAPRLNFVFGEADISSGTAIVSLCRLRQEYYGLPPDKKLFMERATKELVHELGHTFGLEHCSNTKCVMHFSNCLADTDWKEVSFCSQCCPKLRI